MNWYISNAKSFGYCLPFTNTKNVIDQRL
ncbi:uncharacterized protein METZ01_LOCUS205831 [marine metagenome]|uniref:Uncharacterized protein n=1 Tax=marine metagenome TaxID=408172 RepID=A0A382ET12_9ZZZZ